MKRLTPKDWDDVADLWDQCSGMIEQMRDPDAMNSKAAMDYVQAQCEALADKAHSKGESKIELI